VALCDLAISAGGPELLDEIANACRREAAFDNVSAMQQVTGPFYWSLAVTTGFQYRHNFGSLRFDPPELVESEAALENAPIR